MGRLTASSLVLAVGAAAMLAHGCSAQFDPELPPGGPAGIVHPVFGPTHTQAVAPPAISGGTLLIAKDGSAVATDPDRDAVYVVDLASRAVATIPLQPGDEPGRLVEDGNGRVHVALRSGGAIVSIDLASKTVVDRREVCVAPRGIAYDDADDGLYVACASGELVELPAAGGAPTRSLDLDRDLRDVLVRGDAVLVTRFRSAETIVVSKASWTQESSFAPGMSIDGRTPAVAWRSVMSSSGHAVMIHQRGPAASQPVEITPGGYASDVTAMPDERSCAPSIVESAISVAFDDGTAISSASLAGAVLPVDLSLSPDGDSVAVAAAGNAFTPGAQSVLVFDAASLNTSAPCLFPHVIAQPPGQATEVAYTSASTLVVQTREPAALFVPSTGVSIRLSDVSRDDTGHDVFHANSGGNIACASCHPEGADDGRVWTFDGVGARRTPSLRGTVPDTAPYHWSGEMADFSALTNDVFSGRMSGPPLEPTQTAALSVWVDRLPAPVAPAPSDSSSVAHGKQVFEAAQCGTCHGGARFTNNETVDVGTGARFQVPSLVGVGYRAPYLHDGCAATLADRFTSACGGNAHGDLSGLTTDDLDDLVAYLETL